jgi:predicted amidohydrolase YtcJ
LAFGSDAPIESLDPIQGVQTAVTRQNDRGQPRGGWYPSERITVTEAISAYTRGPALITGQESDVGSLGEGRCADLIVLDRSPFDVPTDRIADTRVLATMIDGVWVWLAPDSPIADPHRGAA